MSEAVAAVRAFVETGGDVLLAIALLTLIMWTLIIERMFFFRVGHRREMRGIQEFWDSQPEHISWRAHQVRRLLISRVRLRLTWGLGMINTFVALCPLLGLLGTVTGMIEVFDVMALTGSGNTRGMAAGVSKATLPTMAGMVAALSGMLISTRLERFARDETERAADHLELA